MTLAAVEMIPSGCDTCPPGTRPCGKRARYVLGPGPGQDRTKGCRCEPCRAANRAYARSRDRAARRPDEVLLSAFVPAGPVRSHLAELVESGVGLRTVAARTSLSRDSLAKLLRGERRRVSKRTRELILAISPEHLADGALVPAGPTWERVGQLLAAGKTKAWISAQIGQAGRALQLGREQVTVRNARAIARLVEREVPEGDAGESIAGLLVALAEVVEDRRAPWRARAACRHPGISVDVFFVGRGESTAPAKAICRRCPVKGDCDTYAEEHHEQIGIWAERAPKERRPGRPDEEEVA